MQSNRVHHLDSLRGIASLLVAFDHSLLVFYNNSSLNLFFGRLPVLFFFILSGFVLSGSLFKASALDHSNILAYSLKRIFRLYPAVILSLILCIFFAKYIYASPAEGCTDWIANKITDAESIRTLPEYLYSFVLRNTDLNIALWTIRVELFCSLLLPFIVLVVLKHRILMTPLIYIFSILLLSVLYLKREESASGVAAFLLPFYLGYLIYIFKKLFSILGNSATWIFLALLMVMAIVCAVHESSVGGSIVLAGILGVLVPCNSAIILRFLLSYPLLFLGKISFSLYLIHMPVLLATVSLTSIFFPNLISYQHHIIPFLLIFFISLALTIPLAAICERLVEIPFNNLGHRLSRRFLLKESKLSLR